MVVGPRARRSPVGAGVAEALGASVALILGASVAEALGMGPAPCPGPPPSRDPRQPAFVVARPGLTTPVRVSGKVASRQLSCPGSANRMTVMGMRMLDPRGTT